jgi:anthraniloyl-CoA monooxygenase
MAFRVACIGGGPGGLFFSALFKERMPEAEVVLFERNQATDAFGFGVVFSDATLDRINAADPVVRNGLTDYGVHWDDIEVWLKGEKKTFHGNGMAAIYRKTLLKLLQERAAKAGVDMRFGTFVPDLAELGDFDVIVAADGANSRTREQLGDVLGHTYETAKAKFIWFGTTYKFDGLTFVHRQSEFGNFAVHGYPISDDLSTFIVETDEETWLKAGLDEFDPTQPPGPSDEKTKAFLEELFADDIDGHPLVTNNSRWANFRTRRSETWHKGNVVLLGDAVHTAHFSVGSGTKMAMEDAIVLVRELGDHADDLELAFTNYEAERQPQVAKIQNQARGGLSWWEHFARYYEAFDPTQFTFHFFSRSIDIDKIRLRDPKLVEQTEAAWQSAHGSAVLETPLTVGDVTFSGRALSISEQDGAASLTDGTASLALDGLVLTAPDTEEELDAVFAQIPEQAPVVVIQGGNPFTRTLVSEEARLGRGLTTVVVDDAGSARAETLVLSGRADAVASTSGASHA